MHLVPPREIIVKKDELQKKIDDGMKDIARLQADIQSWKDQLKAIESTLVAVYGGQEPIKPTPVAKTPTAVLTESAAPQTTRRRVAIGEYEQMIVPFMQKQGIARQKEIQDHVSSLLGFPATIDMIKTAIDALVVNPRIPLMRLGRGFIGYQKDPPSAHEQQSLRSQAAAVAA